MNYIGYKKVHIANRHLIKESPLIMIDFNAIAQGYSVDIIARFLESKGIENYLVDVGGEVLGKGKKIDGSPWIVGIEKPAADSEAERIVQTKVQLKNKALCTSGNYRKYRMINGKKYSHEIDPKTGFPVTHKGNYRQIILRILSVISNNLWCFFIQCLSIGLMGLAFAFFVVVNNIKTRKRLKDKWKRFAKSSLYKSKINSITN